MAGKSNRALVVSDVENALLARARFEADYILRFCLTWDGIRDCGKAIDTLISVADRLHLGDGIQAKLKAIENEVRAALSARTGELIHPAF